MNIKELRGMNDEQLAEKLEQTRRDLLGLRVQNAQGELKKHDLFHKKRRTVARILGLLNDRQGEQHDSK